MSLLNKLKAMGESYTNDIAARSFIQAIPILGGALDTIMAGYGSQVQQDRLYALLDSLGKRLDTLEDTIEIEPSEELFDLFRVAVENSIRTRSNEKRERFANIIANAVVSDSPPWDEAETAMRLIGDLEEIHIRILSHAIKAKKQVGGSFNGEKIVSLRENASETDRSHNVSLIEAINDTKPMIIRMACSELVSKGLLNDEATNRVGVGSKDFLSVTDLAEWLLEWISD